MQVCVTNASKSYSTVKAVNNLSFTVDSGEIFAVLGPNGAGKSSTIRMLIGLTYADEGSIAFIDSSGHSSSTLSSQQFGYLPEERGLFQDTTILKTLIYMGQLKDMTKEQAKQSAEDWLERFDLGDRKHDQLRTLSKGNQQKVQLISAIIHNPAVAFLDEPFSGLDPINQEKVIEFLEQLKSKGTTIILSAHQMSLVEKLADRFLLMNNGEAALYGDIDNIRTHSALGSSIELTLENHCEHKEFESYQGVLRTEQISDNQVSLSLHKDTSLPNLLQTLLQQFPVTTLQTIQPTLHDIYLNSLREGSGATESDNDSDGMDDALTAGLAQPIESSDAKRDKP